MMTRLPRFFLADPSLISHTGHCFEYLASLEPAVRASGFSPIYIGNRAVASNLRDEHGIVPVFTHWCDARYRTPNETRRLHERDLARELIDLSKRFQIDNSDVFFINTLRHWALRAVVDWLETLQSEVRPSVALALHFTAYPCPDHSDGTVEYYRQAFDRIASSRVRERIRLVADSEALIEEYQLIAPELTFSLAPIPHTQLSEPRREGDVFRVGYVGEARDNKGFHLLPRLVRRAAEVKLKGVEFHIHSFTRTPDACFFRQSIAGLRHASVTLYPDEMHAEEYRKFLRMLDLVVLPYTLENYHAQTSGVFAEAMSNGSLVVVPRGSWMARQLDDYGGGATFHPGDSEDFSRVALRLIAERDRYRVGRVERINRWRTFHNPERLLQTVLA